MFYAYTVQCKILMGKFDELQVICQNFLVKFHVSMNTLINTKSLGKVMMNIIRIPL